MIPGTPRWRLTETVVINRVLKQTQSLLSISRVLRLISAAEDTTVATFGWSFIKQSSFYDQDFQRK